MTQCSYLQKTKRGWFRFRRRYPSDVASVLKRPVKIVPLHTRDPEEAKMAAHVEAVRFDQEVAALRKSLEKRARKHVRNDDIPALAERFEVLLLYSDEAERSLGLTPAELREHKELIREGAEQTADAVYACDNAAFADDFAGFVEAEGLAVQQDWPVFTALCAELLKAQARAYQLLVERLQGRQVDTPAAAPQPRSQHDYDDLSKLFEHWKVRNKPKAKTVIETQSAIDRFVQFAGVNRVSRIDDTAPARFRDWLLENGNRRSKQSSTLKSRSVKKLIGLVCAVVQTGCDDKYVRHNPFAGLRFPEFKDTTERQRFSVDQLKQFFASPVYTEAYRPVGGAGEAAFWLPLLGLFGGGRETEHGQPRLADIREENGTHYIEVTDTGEEQSLKNDASKRYVPIHAELVRIGFLRYVEWLRRRGETVLFPELRPDSHGALLGCWSKWFNRYLDDIVGIDALGFDYHSLRHTFKHFGRECGMDDNVLDRLQGHAPASEGAKYGGTYPLKRLVAELSLYRIPGLDLGRLTRHPPTGQEPKRRRARRPWSA